MKLSSLTKTTIYAAILGLAVLSARYSCAEEKDAMTNPVQSEKYLYKLTGTSHLTGERVLAYLNPLPTDPSRLEGIIHDNLYIYPLQAIWNGKGTVFAESILTTYHLEVIE